MKIRPVGAHLFHADRRYDGQIDMMKIMVALRNFANARKNGCIAGCRQTCITCASDECTVDNS